MRLTINNIAGIKKADIAIDGITVVAGKNNTGKSTISKAFYCIFNSFYAPKEQIAFDRKSSINSIIRRRFTTFSSGYPIDIVNQLLDPLTDKKQLLSALQKDVEEMLESPNADVVEMPFPKPTELDIDNIAERIQAVASVSDDEMLRKLMTRCFNREFNGQINNIRNLKPGTVSLTISGSTTEVTVEGDEVSNVTQMFNLGTEIAYIDDPFILDEAFWAASRLMPNRHARDHRSDLERKLIRIAGEETLFDEIMFDEKIENIYRSIDQICAGRIVKQGKRGGIAYQPAEDVAPLDVRNLSSGLKTFVILKELLRNGTLQENGSVILDEPEIHLHPQWQLEFARLIVLIHKEFGMHILLNTHSPYFLRAIEVYCSLFEVADSAHYYLANESGEVVDVTSCTEEIYNLLARPLDELEELAYDVL